MLTKIDRSEIPAIRGRKTYYSEDLEKMLNDGIDCAEVTDLRGVPASTASLGYRYIINSKKLPLTVIVRKSRVFIVRKED